MKTTVSEHDFLEAFRRMDRMSGWTRSGLLALFEYLEQYEEDCGEEIEFDVIAICCDYTEYNSAVEAAKEFGWERPAIDEDDSQTDEDREEEANEAATEWLRDQTTVIEIDGGGVVIQAF